MTLSLTRAKKASIFPASNIKIRRNGRKASRKRLGDKEDFQPGCAHGGICNIIERTSGTGKRNLPRLAVSRNHKGAIWYRPGKRGARRRVVVDQLAT